MSFSIKLLSGSALFIFLIFTIYIFNASKERVDVTLVWEPSSEFENGDVLTSLEIENYIIQWSDMSGDILGEKQVSGDTNRLILKQVEVGMYIFVIKSISVYGTESMPLEFVKRIDSIAGIL